MLYTVELCVITNLFMPIAKFTKKRTIIYGGNFNTSMCRINIWTGDE